MNLQNTTSPLTERVLNEINKAFGMDNWALTGSNLLYCKGLITRTNINDVDIVTNEIGYNLYLTYYKDNFRLKLSNKKQEALFLNLDGYTPPLFYQYLFIKNPLKKIDVFVYDNKTFEKYVKTNINLYNNKVQCFNSDLAFKIKRGWIGKTISSTKHMNDYNIYKKLRGN